MSARRLPFLIGVALLTAIITLPISGCYRTRLPDTWTFYLPGLTLKIPRLYSYFAKSYQPQNERVIPVGGLLSLMGLPPDFSYPVDRGGYDPVVELDKYIHVELRPRGKYQTLQGDMYNYIDPGRNVLTDFKSIKSESGVSYRNKAIRSSINIQSAFVSVGGNYMTYYWKPWDAEKPSCGQFFEFYHITIHAEYDCKWSSEQSVIRRNVVAHLIEWSSKEDLK